MNKIYNIDCLDGMKMMDTKSVDLIITSPPYSDMKEYVDFKGIHPDDYVEWFLPIVKESYRLKYLNYLKKTKIDTLSVPYP